MSGQGDCYSTPIWTVPQAGIWLGEFQLEGSVFDAQSEFLISSLLFALSFPAIY